MEFEISKVEAHEVPKAHRGSGAETENIANSLHAFVAGSVFGEWFHVDVEDAGLFEKGLRAAAAANGVGVHVRLELDDPTLQRIVKSGKTDLDKFQSGSVYFSFDKKREGVGRKKGTKNTKK